MDYVQNLFCETNKCFTDIQKNNLKVDEISYFHGILLIHRNLVKTIVTDQWVELERKRFVSLGSNEPKSSIQRC